MEKPKIAFGQVPSRGFFNRKPKEKLKLYEYLEIEQNAS